MIKQLTLVYISLILFPIISFILSQTTNLPIPDQFLITLVGVPYLLCFLVLSSLCYSLTKGRYQKLTVSMGQKCYTTMLSLVALTMILVLEGGMLFSVGLANSQQTYITFINYMFLVLLPVMAVLLFVLQIKLLRSPRTAN